MTNTLTGEQLAAIGALWQKRGHEFVAGFGGMSMLPTIAPGQQIRIICGGGGEAGDVVLIVNKATPVVHRIVGVGPQRAWVLTRGDNNLLPDVPLRDESAIVGRVAGVTAWRDTSAQRVILALCRRLLSLPLHAGDRCISILIWARRLSSVALTAVSRRRPTRSDPVPIHVDQQQR